MNKLFVSYPLAKVLEDKGFNDSCIATIDQTEYLHINGTKSPEIRGAMCYDTIPCPLWQQVTKWLRDNKNILIQIGTSLSDPLTIKWFVFIAHPFSGEGVKWKEYEERYSTYEQALDAGIYEALKLL